MGTEIDPTNPKHGPVPKVEHEGWTFNLRGVLSKIEADLLATVSKQLVKKMRGSGRTSCIERLNRLGWSGARLFLLYPADTPTTLPFVVKIHDRKSIEKERTAAKALSLLLSDAKESHCCYHKGGWGALVFEHKGGSSEAAIEQSREFQELLLAQDTAMDEKMRILTSIYDDNKLRIVHKYGQKRIRVSPRRIYNDYLREPESSERLRSALGRDADTETFTIFGMSMPNPLHALERLPNEFECTMSATHGDVHPKNVIRAGNGTVGLIDFAWSQQWMHSLVDFVMMENSLRFFCFPHLFDLPRRIDVDNMLLTPEGPSVLDSPTPYKDMIQMVRAVRELAHAASVLGDFREYLLAQFLVLYGQFAIEDYVTAENLWTLGRIARELQEQGVLLPEPYSR